MGLGNFIGSAICEAIGSNVGYCHSLIIVVECVQDKPTFGIYVYGSSIAFH